MLNRLKKRLERDPPGGVPKPNSNDGNTSEQSGFICPMCMANMKSAEDLQSHFDIAHSSPESDNQKISVNRDNSNGNIQDTSRLPQQSIPHESLAAPNKNGVKDTVSITPENITTLDGTVKDSQDDIALLQGELADLKSSLNEEKWYSAELKKEMETLKNEKVKISTDSEVVQKQLAIAVATNEELAKQKENLERKAINMAEIVADVKASKDELESQKAAVDERCKNQSVELEKAATWVRDLESQLPPGESIEGFIKDKLQRPGADDVMVLKKELVSVQTLMDQLTMESEEKGKEVEKERQHLQNLLEEARNQATIVQQEFDAYKVENARLKSENEETATANLKSLKDFEEEKEKLNQLYSDQENTRQEELKNLQASLEKEQSYSQSLEAENNRLQEDKIAMKEDISRLSTELNNVVQLSEKDKASYDEIKQNYQDSESAKIELKSKLAQLEEQLAALRQDTELSASEKEALFESVSAERDDLKSQTNELERAIEETNKRNEKLNQQLDELRDSSKQSEIDGSSQRHKLEIEVAQLKIKLESLVDDNQSLLAQKSAAENSLESMRSGHEEERNSLQMRLLDSERQILSLNLKTSQLEEEKLQKSENFDEIQAKLLTTQTALEEAQSKTHTLNTEFALKTQEIESLKEKLTRASTKLEDEAMRTEKASEEATKLREERTYLMAQMEAGEGEAAARAQIAEENNLLRKQKEETEEKLRMEMSQHESALSDLNVKLSQTNALLSATQEQLHSSEQTIFKLRDESSYERERLVQTESELKSKTELLATTEAAGMTQRADIENHLSTVKRSLEDKIRELEKSNEDLLSSRSAFDELKTQMNQLRQDHHVEFANIRSTLERSKSETTDALNEVERWKEELKRMEETNLRESEKRKDELKNVEAKHAEKLANLQATVAEVRDELTKKSDDHRREESQRTLVEVELNQAKRQLIENEEKSGKIQLKLDESLAALQKFYVDLSEAQTKQETLCKELKEEKLKSATEQDDLKKKIEQTTEDFEAQIKLLKEDLANKQKTFEEDELTKKTTMESLAQSKSQLGELQIQLDDAQKLIEDIRTQKAATEEKLTTEISNHLETIGNITSELASSKRHDDERALELEEKAKKIETTQQELNKVRDDLDQQTTLLTETEVELENNKIELQASLHEVETLKDKSSLLTTESQDLETKLSDHLKTINELKEKLEISENENKTVSAELATSKDNLRSMEDEALARKLEFEERCQCLEDELANHKDHGETLKAELDEEKLCRESEEKKSIEETKKFKAKENLWEMERKNFHEKVQSLEAAQSLLISHKVELQKLIENLQGSVDHEKKNVIAIEEASRRSAETKDAMIKSWKEQLENKTREFESAKADHVVSESRLQLEIGTLSENLNSTRSEWVASTQKVDAMAREHDDLKGQLMVLRATVQSNSDERRALLERCLNGEQQVEQQKVKINDLQRKLEDVHSAMHELGRENQALQVKHTNTISRQWADDSKINNCKACGRDFSLTVRKHHCRHCGDIFCNDCSSRSATVAASKNPVRVCERCYDDLLVAS